jgi:hypothetical protein
MQRLKVKLKPFDATIAKNHSKRRFRPVIHQLFQLRKELLDSRRRQKKQQAEMITDKSRKFNGLQQLTLFPLQSAVQEAAFDSKRRMRLPQ